MMPSGLVATIASGIASRSAEDTSVSNRLLFEGDRLAASFEPETGFMAPHTHDCWPYYKRCCEGSHQPCRAHCKEEQEDALDALWSSLLFVVALGDNRGAKARP